MLSSDSSSLTSESVVSLVVLLTTVFNLSIPYSFIALNAKSNTKTIKVVTRTIASTATVLLNNCLGVGQTTFFNSALKLFIKLVLSLLFLTSFLAILLPP